MKRFCLFVYFLFIVLFTHAQYSGGSGDGSSVSQVTNQNPLPNIYHGGSDDGSSNSSVTNQNPLPNIYHGENDDGSFHSSVANQNSLPNIYVGGNDDGSSHSPIANPNPLPDIYIGDGSSHYSVANQNPLPNIYHGGNDDGSFHSSVANQNSLPNIYVGGNDDGFAQAPVTNQNPLPEIYHGGNDDGFGLAVVSNMNPCTQTTSNITIIACDHYLWNGVDYTTSGDKTYTTANSVGCDSTATLHLTINHSSTSSTTVTSCDHYLWNAVDYTTSGDRTYTTTNSVGCDSTATLHLTINHSTTSSTTIIACGHYLWNGVDYTISGDKTYTTTNSVGCDSTATLHLTINHSTTSSTTIIACDHYLWNGVDYTTSGDKTYTTTNSVGCDSTATLHLTINHSSTSSTTVTSCDHYLWNGVDYTTSGDKTYTTTNSVGCDSTATLHLIINHSSTSSTTITACDHYLWNGTDYASSGDYTVHFTNAVGCDSAATLHLTINIHPAINTQPISAIKCIGENTTFNVAASGTGLTYQWYKGLPGPSTLISGQTSSSYTISNINVADAADYYVVVNGTCTPAVTSNVGKLMVKEVIVSAASQQYSDKEMFTARIYNGASLASIVTSVDFKIDAVPGAGGSFVIGNAAMNVDGINLKGILSNVSLLENSFAGGNPPTGPLSPAQNGGVKNVKAIFKNAANVNVLTDCYASTNLTVSKEDARAYYTGALFVSTSSQTSSNATVTLSATIKDITAVNSLSDANGGDIRNAIVKFVNRDAGNAVIATIPVGLVNPADPKVGTATYNWAVDIGNQNSQTYHIGIIVENYYTRNSSDDNTEVTVSKPLNDFITGGGYLVLTNSGGVKAGDAGSKNNFGFNVKYNKSGTNLQGNINTIIRKTESDGLHVYQVKGNQMNSLSVNSTKSNSHPYPTAVFTGKASIQDITDPSLPVSVDGNATLLVSMTDAGEPGSSDKIAITVWNKNGGLWYSSNWNGTITIEQLLGGGNLKINGGNVGSSTTNPATVPVTLHSEEIKSEKQKFIVYPNPGSGLFTLRMEAITDLSGYDYHLYSQTGVGVKEGKIINVITHFDITKLPAGTYSLQIMKNEKPQTTIQIILIK
jgi:hypothetical protein